MSAVEMGEVSGDLKPLIEYDGTGPRRKLRSHQFRALIFKTLTLQFRARYTLCCQCCVPLLLILFIGAIQLSFVYLLKANFEGTLIDELDKPQRWDYVYWTGDEESYMLMGRGEAVRLDVLGNRTQNDNGTGLLWNYPSVPNSGRVAMVKNGKGVTRDEVQDWVREIKKKWEHEKELGLPLDGFKYPVFTTYFSRLDASVCAGNGSAHTPGCLQDVSNVTMEVMTEKQVSPYVFPNAGDSGILRVSGIYLAYDALYGAVAQGRMYLSMPISAHVPFKLIISVDIGSFVAVMLFPLAFSFLFPVMVYNIVLEKQEKLREMMRMSGLRMWKYWLVQFGWDVVLYVCVAGMLSVLSIAFGLGIAVNGSYLANAITLVLWGLALIGQAFFMSTVFSRTRAAIIVCYVGTILLTVVSLVVNSVWFRQNPSPWWWNLHPFFSFSRIVVILGFTCGADLCPQWSDYDLDFEIVQLWFYLLGETIVVYILALYLDQIMPREWGVTKKPWFPLNPLIRVVRFLYRKVRARIVAWRHGGAEYAELGASTGSAGGVVPVGEVGGSDEDDDEVLRASGVLESGLLGGAAREDVERERGAVLAGDFPPDSPVVVREMRKMYGARFFGAKKLAVGGVTMHVPRGQCFGLLGPNGAGKTTLISILTGLFKPSGGQAHVGGFNVATEIDKAHQVMGVCPQFEIMWMDLTCLETLLFYARLKGVPWRREKAECREILESVGLLEAQGRRVKALSGGMRRRLAVAVALVGDPDIVFLDEPTTGLDPASRRQLWEVLARAKEGRSLILTTHSMDEADVLCDRIGIMSRGTLRCIGPQQELKNRFGSGYSIVVNFAPGRAAEVEQFVTRILPDATIEDRYVGQITFGCRADRVVVSRVFDEFERYSSEPNSPIVDWGITQTTLEDVFLRIVRQDEAEVYE